MRTLTAKETVIAATAQLNVGHANERLWTHKLLAEKRGINHKALFIAEGIIWTQAVKPGGGVAQAGKVVWEAIGKVCFLEFMLSNNDTRQVLCHGIRGGTKHSNEG